MVAMVERLGAVEPDSVVAQYLATRLTWWGSYRRILTLNASHFAMFNPEDFQCTNRWPLGDIVSVELAPEPDQFLVQLNKSHFRSGKLRFQCHARSHFLALVHTLRRRFTFQPVRFHYSDGRRPNYQCTEHFADGAFTPCLLQVGLSRVTLLDEHGRCVARFPYEHLQRIAASTAHPDGLVLATMFQERLFLCPHRAECLEHIASAARALGVVIPVEQSPLNMQLLRLQNTHLLDNPAAVCFEVDKVVDDAGELVQSIQLIFQGAALLEVHRKIRTVIRRAYTSLLVVVRSEWDEDTVVLEFVHGETLVLHVNARDQFIAVLLLVCRETGNEHVELAPAKVHKSRRYHPHISENMTETAGPSMESFLLRRVIEAARDARDTSTNDTVVVGNEHGLMARHQDWRRQRKEKKLRERMNLGMGRPAAAGAGDGGATENQYYRVSMPSASASVDGRLSMDSAVSFNDHVSLTIAMEELITNVPFKGLTGHCDRRLLNGAIHMLTEHLLVLSASLRPFAVVTVDVVVTLQSLARLAQSSHAYFRLDMAPRLFEALHGLLLREHFLTRYWCLKLLQCYFEPRKMPVARRHRARALQDLVDNKLLLAAILELVPTTSSVSAETSGRWVRSDIGDSLTAISLPMEDTALFSREARLEKDMNILTYEALFTLHHLLIFLSLHERVEHATASMKTSTPGDVDAAANKSYLTSKKHRHAKKSRGRSFKGRHWAASDSLDLSDEDDFEDDEGSVEHTSVGKTSAPRFTEALAAQAQEEIGEKLLDKVEFLMEAVVDIRLARACQTIVALVTFLVQRFGSGGRVEGLQLLAPLATANGAEAANAQRSVPAYLGDPSATRRRRVSLPLRRSSLDVVPADGDVEGHAKRAALARKVDQLLAFLAGYQNDIATLDDRSMLFQVQNTILMPLAGVGGQPQTPTDEDGSSISTTTVATGGVQNPAMRAEYLQLEHLYMNEADDDDDQDDDKHDENDENGGKCVRVRRNGTKDVDRNGVTKDDDPCTNGRRKPTRTALQRLNSLHALDNAVDRSEDGGVQSSDGIGGLSGFQSAYYQEGFGNDKENQPEDASSERRGRDRLRHSLTGPLDQDPAMNDERSEGFGLRGASSRSSKGVARERKIQDRVQRRARAQSVANDRTYAHTCDACICCNDVCEHDDCFFCAEKEYQLRCAFATASLSAVSTSELANSSNIERNYSSCELQRHQNRRSCWVIVNGSVFDVTDLLGVHSGGMQVLLEAARRGIDAGPSMLEAHHSPDAWRILEDYRLGDYYKCEKRTVPLG